MIIRINNRSIKRIIITKIRKEFTRISRRLNTMKKDVIESDFYLNNWILDSDGTVRPVDSLTWAKWYSIDDNKVGGFDLGSLEVPINTWHFED